jgi:indolepyruvate ferredoxin oxidoreductase alpha subunit
MPPLTALDTCVCMGASIGAAHGLEKAGVDPATVVGVIGDSTFLHSGIPALLDMVYNGAHGTILILDNSTTAMTGRQQHPGTGKTLAGNPAPKVDLPVLLRALGVEDVVVVDPYDLEALQTGLQAALAHPGPSVLITSRPCMLIPHEQRPGRRVDEERCRLCGRCLQIGCPAIGKVEVDVEGKTRVRPQIDIQLCQGCGVCAAVCPFEALPVAEIPASVRDPY